jgi:uncharacterized membrane protein YfbV (UPF0208 family)
MSIKNALTGKNMSYTKLMSLDKKSYTMLPPNAEVWFKELSKNGYVLKGPGRIVKPTLKWNDINYVIEFPVGSLNYTLSKASLIQITEP